MAAKQTSGFWRGEVGGRRTQLLKDPVLRLSLCLGAATVIIAPRIPLGSVKIETVAEFALLYAALSFGAAIAGAGITLGVPGNQRIRLWSQLKAEKSKYSVFQNLLFVFAWSAMTQIALVIVAFLALAFGAGFEVLPPGVNLTHAPIHWIAAFLSFWLWWYSLFELTAVVRTFMQVASAIVIEESTPSTNT